MLFHILKKDLVKRKGVNVILFLFITLATIFLASSVNNILAVTSAVEYYTDYANIPAVQAIFASEEENAEVSTFLENQLQDGKIHSYAYDSMITIAEKGIQIIDQKKQKSDFNANGVSLFLGKMNPNYNAVYDEEGKTITLQDHEIAVSRITMENHQLQIGDQLEFRINDKLATFTIAQSTKDAAYGNDMIGMMRFIINEDAYEKIEKENSTFGVFYIMCDDVQAVNQAISNEPFYSLLNVFDKSMYSTVYSMDMIFAALLILIGICLILIALLVLRFTLLFTMEEEYQEIGILKAMGLRNGSIKKLYLLKYFVLVSAGAFVGLMLSFPVSNIMVESISANMIMEKSSANYMVNIICGIAVVLFVLAFCYSCTHKLNKVSAITAIHGGNSGERFGKFRGIALWKRKRLPVSFYLGMNDITCNIKRYTALIITFCISFVLITIPLNVVNTMNSTEMISKFSINPESTILVNRIEQNEESKYSNVHEVDAGMERLKEAVRGAGIQDVKATAAPLYFFRFAKDIDDDKTNIMTVQLHGDDTDYLEYSQGSAPQLENEIAFSTKILEEKNWAIGDWVTMTLMNQEKEFIITGTYSDYMQLGKSARLNPKLDCSAETMFSYGAVMLKFPTTQTSEEVKASMIEKLPAYEWKTSQEFVDLNIGGIQATIDSMLIPMTGMLCGVVMLVTLLMGRLFIAREKGEIAMMRSVGFSKRAIRNWQLFRMVCIVAVSMLIAIPLSLIDNQFLIKSIFAVMGADVTIQVEILEAYVIYPGVLFVAILIATAIATMYIRKINIREMNNLE